MSTLRSIRVRGKNIEVFAVRRAAFRSAHPTPYRALEDSDVSIPPELHVSTDCKRLFVVDVGLVPAIYTWDGKRWMEVKR